MTFTLSDAIEHEKEMAESGYGSSDRANEHRQLSIWLEHYQNILNLPNCNDCVKKMALNMKQDSFFKTPCLNSHLRSHVILSQPCDQDGKQDQHNPFYWISIG